MNKSKLKPFLGLAGAVLSGLFLVSSNVLAEDPQPQPIEVEQQEETTQVMVEVSSHQFYVFSDDNKNGVQDDAETGIAGVVFNLFDAQGEIILSGTTDSQGVYRFENLPVGDYRITLSRPTGYQLAPNSQPWVELDQQTVGLALTLGLEEQLIPVAFYQPRGSVTVRFIDEAGKSLRDDLILLQNQPVGTTYDARSVAMAELTQKDQTYKLLGLAVLEEDGQLRRQADGQLVLLDKDSKEQGQLEEGDFQFVYVYASEPAADKEETDSGDKATEEEKPKTEPEFEGSPVSDGFTIVVAENPYVDHWSGESAYEHNVFKQRYGISAEQLDGFIGLLGYDTDVTRVTGEKLLHWQEISGIDARVLMAYAMQDSALGFVEAGSDERPALWAKGTGVTDDEHVLSLAAFLREEQNQTLEAQDLKAQAILDQTSTSGQGQTYFDDDSAQVRQAFMEDIDAWIDDNGGTPEAPEITLSVQVLGSASHMTLPKGYHLAANIDTSTYVTQSYPWGQCTWYVYNRAMELGIQFDAYMGNGGDWQHKPGFDISSTPQVGAAVSFAPGQAGASSEYGHVAIVEAVAEDGSILISESNARGLGVVSYRLFSAEDASQLTYVIGHPMASSTN